MELIVLTVVLLNGGCIPFLVVGVQSPDLRIINPIAIGENIYDPSEALRYPSRTCFAHRVERYLRSQAELY